MTISTAELDKTTETKSDTLTAADRCDGCSAQAYVSVVIGEGGLLFCAHHYTKYEAKLGTVAGLTLDERWKLGTGKLDVSPM